MDNISDKKRQIVKDDYNAIAEIYADCYGKIDYCKTYIDNFVSMLSGKRILDIGCGAGQITDYLAQKGFDVIGIDFSQGLLKIARQNFPNLRFVCVDICNYEQKEKFDGIIAKDMLFHLPDENLIQVLKKIRELLEENGIFCVIMDMPKVSGEQVFVEELNDKYQIYYNYLTPDKLKNLMVQTDFKINSINIVKNNDNASSYATGLMVFLACK